MMGREALLRAADGSGPSVESTVQALPDALDLLRLPRTALVEACCATRARTADPSGRGGSVRCETAPHATSPPEEPAAMFTQFVVKLYSRCNFGCPDCYVYEHRDRGWRAEPLIMSPATMRRLCIRIAEHLRRHRPQRAQVALHGGEPLLAGPLAVERFARGLRDETEGLPTQVDLLVQTNASLLDRAFLDVFRRYGITVGVSVDGTPESHDRRRPDRGGHGTYTEVARALSLLRTPRHRPLYRGLLCVIDIEADPVATYEALLEHEPPAVDLLLPLATWQFLRTVPRGRRRAVRPLARRHVRPLVRRRPPGDLGPALRLPARRAAGRHQQQ